MQNTTSDFENEIVDWSTLTGKQELFERAGHEWIFRGQSGENWPLSTSLERSAIMHCGLDWAKIPDLEIKIILEFVRHYHLYAAEPPPQAGDTLEWLALMRHHGAPTRLLDFTFSFAAAAYFALEDRPEGNPIVWAVNKTWLTNLLWKWADGAGSAETLARFATLRDGAAFRDIFLKRCTALVAPVTPFRLNQRLTIQNGMFLCPGNVGQAFQEILDGLDGRNGNVLKVAISADSRPQLLRRLDREGINRASLFPGLDGFAQSLRTRMLLLSHLQDMEQSTARHRINIGIETLGKW